MADITLQQLNKKNGQVLTAQDLAKVDDNFAILQDTINNVGLIWQAITNYRNTTNISDSLAKGYLTQEQADTILLEIIK